MPVTVPTNYVTYIGTSLAPALSLPTAPAVGSCIAVFISVFPNGPTYTVADNKGNTYTPRWSTAVASTQHYCFTAPVGTSGGTFTVTPTRAGGGGDVTVLVLEQPGTHVTVPYNIHGISSSNTLLTTVSATPTAVAMAVLGHVSWDGGTTTLSQADTLVFKDLNGNTNMPLSVQWRRDTLATAKATQQTLGTSQPWFAGILILDEAAAGGGPASKNNPLLGNPFQRLHRGAKV